MRNKYKIIYLLSTQKLVLRLVIMMVNGGMLFSIFYGLTTDLSGLGLSSIELSGIFVGLTQCIGCLVVIPFIPRMRRKMWGLIF